MTACPFKEPWKCVPHLGPHSPLPWPFGREYSAKHVFPPMEQASNPTTKQLVIPKTAIPLFQQWAYVPWGQHTIDMLHGCTRPGVTFLPQSPTQHLSICQSAGHLQLRAILVSLRPVAKGMVPLTIQSHHLVLVGNCCGIILLYAVTMYCSCWLIKNLWLLARQNKVRWRRQTKLERRRIE